MALEIKRETPKPVELPIEEVTLSDAVPGRRAQRRSVTVRPESTGSVGGGRTIVCRQEDSYNRLIHEFKFVAMLGDLREFGEALIAIADGK